MKRGGGREDLVFLNIYYVHEPHALVSLKTFSFNLQRDAQRRCADSVNVVGDGRQLNDALLHPIFPFPASNQLIVHSALDWTGRNGTRRDGEWSRGDGVGEWSNVAMGKQQ
ncbi:unnamed protein product [Enterobius vermicularis]|uniref:Uncharacterized protein n=1 Tax=Enterobius vermicularis TaxID=51028 RepID=A0A0N4UZ29_ENTVE|nr:unnamed protein product [Enterobius vermicularis]